MVVRDAATIDHIKNVTIIPNTLHSTGFDTSLLSMSVWCKEYRSGSWYAGGGCSFCLCGNKSSWIDCSTTGKTKRLFRLLKDYCPAEIYCSTIIWTGVWIPLENYFAVLGPCHAEEVAAENYPISLFQVQISGLRRSPRIFPTVISIQ